MGALPLTSRVGTILLVVATGAAYWLALRSDRPRLGGEDIAVAIILGALIVFAEVFDISFPHAAGEFHVSVAAPLALAAGLQLGPLVGGVVVMTAILAESVYARRTPVKAIVNVVNLGLVTLLGAAVYELVAGVGTALDNLRNMAAVVAAGLVFTLVNVSTLSVIVAPIVGTSPLRMFRTHLSGIYVELLTLPTFGAVVPVLAEQHPVALLVLIIPLVSPLLAYRGFDKAREETRATMERLADALERRDPYTHEHSVRVTEYVEMILKELPDVPFETVQGILAAARVHDLGKVGVRDLTLNKPGVLTTDERAEIEGHAAIGAEIVERLWVYRRWAGVIRHHHERWDGAGYPDGLAGDAIPLGARIIGVADAFDAMTSDRVYRRALSRDVALHELRAMSGTQFDPAIVAALGRALQGAAVAAPIATPLPVPSPGPKVPAAPTA